MADLPLIELLFRTLSDHYPERSPTAAYLYAQTSDNQGSVLDRAALLTQLEELWIAESPPRNGYPGFDKWCSELEGRGVSASRIVPVPTAEHAILNTRTEAESVVKLARERRTKALYVIASPLHQLRAFMTLISVALESAPTLRLYSLPGNSLDWQEHAVHSQGTVSGTRSALVAGELERIVRYQQKGDLAPLAAVLSYLNQRDTKE